MSAQSIVGEFKAYKTGHHLNNMLLRTLLADATAYKLITIEDGMHCAEQNRFLEEEKVSDFVLA